MEAEVTFAMRLIEHDAPSSHTLNQQLLSGLCKAGASRMALNRYTELLNETPSSVCMPALISALVSCHCNAELALAAQSKFILHGKAHLLSFQCQLTQVCTNTVFATSKAATGLLYGKGYAKRSSITCIYICESCLQEFQFQAEAVRSMLQAVHYDQPAEAELACQLVDSVIIPDNQALHQVLLSNLCRWAEPQLAMMQLQHRYQHLTQPTEVYEALLGRLLSMKGP